MLEPIVIARPEQETLESRSICDIINSEGVLLFVFGLHVLMQK